MSRLMHWGRPIKLDRSSLDTLPKGKGCGPAQYAPGDGVCPVDGDQPISVWYTPDAGPYQDRGWWNPLKKARYHDWKQPSIYRLRKVRVAPSALEPNHLLRIATALERIADFLTRVEDEHKAREKDRP